MKRSHSMQVLTSMILVLLFAVSHLTIAAPVKKIVLIAGKKSHNPGDHEYLKSVRLLKVMLDAAPALKGVKTEMHFNGWPENPATLDDASTIVLLSDGGDWDEASHPFMVSDRMKLIEKQMKRGCGLVLFHYSTFAPTKYATQFQEWTGGYFDYENGSNGPRKTWYSDIKHETAELRPATPSHPISNGLKPFTIREEFYFKIHFKENDPRWKPIINVSISGVDPEQTVAWAVERADGGKGFGFTGGHYFKNWEVEGFRKLILNAIVWTAGIQVPNGGIESKYRTEEEVLTQFYTKPIKGLILTGYHSPHHKWNETTPLLDNGLKENPRIMVDVSENIEDLATIDLKKYDFLVLNYCNWDKPGLSDQAKTAFTNYLNAGGGLLIIHFSAGSFHRTLPFGETGDWPEYRKICRRVWDHKDSSAHDQYGAFTVNISNSKHAITKGLSSFETTDELYFKQRGTLPIDTLVTAKSKLTGKNEPLAWTCTYGKGKIFQTLLGHDKAAVDNAGFKRLLINAAFWVSEK